MARFGWCVWWVAFCAPAMGCGAERVGNDWGGDGTGDDDFEDRAQSTASGTSSARTSPTATNTGARPSSSATFEQPGITTGRSEGSGGSGADTLTPLGPALCGNARMDSGEACDDGEDNSDTQANACRTSCEKARCGDGVRDAGESCDTGTQNSDTDPDSCRTDCTLPRCGDRVVDVGRAEACDGTPNCGPRCTVAVCGDNVLEGEEECEPALGSGCTTQCTREVNATTSDEGTSEEATNDSSGTGDTIDSTAEPQTSDPDQPDESDSGADDTAPPSDSSGELLFDFESDEQGWVLYETSPESLESKTLVVHDATNGRESAGALKLYAPFEASDQKLETQVSFDKGRDMSGRILRARARLSSGLSRDSQNPGGIKLFVKTGANYSYAAGAFVALTEGFGWVEFVIDMDEPELVFESDEYDPTQVRQVGIELRTFEQTQQALPATVYVDSISF